MILGDGIGTFIPTPPEIANKKAVINPKNYDDKCFLHCVAIFQNKKNHSERYSNDIQEEIKKFNVKGMKFPVEMRDIEIFVKINNISIHIFGWNGRIFTHRKPKKREKHIYLLMLQENNKKHFCLVKSLSRLLRKEYQRKAKRFYCDNCLNWRSTPELLQKHQEFCEKQKPCETFPPKKSSIMKYRNFRNQTSVPFRIYADSEAILSPCEDQGHGEYQKHIPCGFCFFTVAESGDKFSPILTKGENCVDEFLDKLIKHVQFLQNLPEKCLVMTKEDEEKFQKSKGCWFCGEEIKGLKVRDH